MVQTIAQRTASEEELWRELEDNLNFKLRVVLPAKVVSFDGTKQTIVAEPLLREKIVNRQTQVEQWMEIPNLLDVPVVFPQAGPFVITFPIQAGDEVLIVFADMCIDSWWANGGVQNWNDRRRHDLSDGFAIPGVNSVPNVIANIANNAMEMRTKNGACKISMTTDTITISAPNVNINTNVLTETINDHQTTNITNNMSTTVGGNVTWNVTGDYTETIAGYLSTTVSSTINLISTGDAVFIDSGGGHKVIIQSFGFSTHVHGGVALGSGFTTGVAD